jgi:hypothetical protein
MALSTQFHIEVEEFQRSHTVTKESDEFSARWRARRCLESSAGPLNLKWGRRVTSAINSRKSGGGCPWGKMGNQRLQGSDTDATLRGWLLR